MVGICLLLLKYEEKAEVVKEKELGQAELVRQPMATFRSSPNHFPVMLNSTCKYILSWGVRG